MQLQDFDAELIARGFDGVQPSIRTMYINFGYRTVARKFPEMWAENEVTLPTVLGTPYFTLSPNASGGDINNYYAIDTVSIITDPYRNMLEYLSDEDFYQFYYPTDLTASANRGIPESYHIDDDKLYILPPSSQVLTIRVQLHRQPGTLVNVTDVPITPVDLDEAILDATLLKLHTRVKEFLEADQYNTFLADALDDALSNETLIRAQEQERTEPDDGWI